MTAALRVLGVGAACFLIAILGVSAAPGSPDSAPSNLSVSASPTGLPTSPKAAPASTDPDSGPVSWAAPADIVPQCDAEDGLFPGSLFDQEQLRHGAVVLYFAVAFYGFCVIALVCENYFLPTVEIICDEMGLSPDIAAATFMSLASSAPELFVNVVTTFLTRSTMGVGTTVGSATFNVLGLSSFIGLAARSPISIRAGPVVRDSLLYVCAITITTCVVWDGRVEWWEALAMVLCSLAYLTFMFTHTRLALWARALMVRSGSTIMLTQATRNADDESSSVASSVITTVSASVASCEDVVFEASNPPAARAVSWDSNISDQPNAAVRSDKAVVKRWRRVATRVWQFLSSPVSFALALTIVDCKKPKLRRFYLLTFLLCVVWIALAAYIVSWMLAVIGNTLQISDAVMGITLLAAGGSTPEAISAIIMARKGVGSVGIANGLGANTLNMLMNLGMPWLVRSLIFPDLPWTVLSEGLPFDLGSLLSAVLVLNIVLAVSRYRLCRTQGICSFAVYIFFIVLLVLIELNVFGLYKSSECSSS